MSAIHRNPESFENEQFDLIVIGGGIYGVCVLLEASQRGWKCLLIERDDYGGATSLNSLRIIHGGLRYLQTMDLARFRRSVREQSWWLHCFPDLIDCLPCLMPLYNQGMRRMNTLRIALTLNDWLASPIRRQVSTQSWQPSEILSAYQTCEQFPSVRRDRLKGAAKWFDAKMNSPQRLIVELLRWAIAGGGSALNYMECTELKTSGQTVHAVRARCHVTQREYEFKTKYVVNCCGPWAGKWMPTQQQPGGVENWALAFNIVVDRSPLAPSGLAVTPPEGRPTYFLVPRENQTMIGTEHLAPQGAPMPSFEQIDEFIGRINAAIPGLQLTREEISQIQVGRLWPQTLGEKTPAKSPKILHHEAFQGPTNMVSVVGPKYTTARHVAEMTIRSVGSKRGWNLDRTHAVPRPEVDRRVGLFSNFEKVNRGMAQDLQSWMEDESVVFVDDFVLRRLDLDVSTQRRFGEFLAKELHWANSKSDQLTRLEKATSLWSNNNLVVQTRHDT